MVRREGMHCGCGAVWLQMGFQGREVSRKLRQRFSRAQYLHGNVLRSIALTDVAQGETGTAGRPCPFFLYKTVIGYRLSVIGQSGRAERTRMNADAR